MFRRLLWLFTHL